MEHDMKKTYSLVVAAMTGALAASLAFGTAAVAQTSASDTSANAASPAPSASTPKEQRKAARKQARAKKNAELKQLEKNGYNPATANSAQYPNDIQNAEKKAGAAGGASQ
jgi:hypothetical protein